MRGLVLIAGLVMAVATATGQISTQYTNFMFFRQVYNPAVAGTESYADFTGLFRAQWLGIPGAPTSEALSFHAPITRISSGLGLLITNDLTGEQRVTSVVVNYSYGHNFKFGRLSGGIGLGIHQLALNGSLLIAPQGNPENDFGRDPYIPSTNVSAVAPVLNAGIYFNNDNLFAGFSVANIIQTSVKLPTQETGTSITDARTMILMAGYAIKLNKNLHLIPNVLVKTDVNTFQTDLNLLLQYKNNIYGGFTFRGSSNKTIDALAAMIGFRVFKDLSLGYSYDFSLSALNNVNSGSHEVYLNYRLKMKDWSKPGKVIYNPRFL